MAKAHVTTKNGTKVTIEGTPDEVVTLVARLGGDAAARQTSRKKSAARHSQRSATISGPVNLIAELIDGGFFKKPKELGAIKTALAEQGHHYPVTTLSPIALRLVRKRMLRRIKEKNRWLYVG